MLGTLTCLCGYTVVWRPMLEALTCLCGYTMMWHLMHSCPMLAQLLPLIHLRLHLGHLYSPKHRFLPWYGVSPSPLGRACTVTRGLGFTQTPGLVPHNITSNNDTRICHQAREGSRSARHPWCTASKVPCSHIHIKTSTHTHFDISSCIHIYRHRHRHTYLDIGRIVSVHLSCTVQFQIQTLQYC